jgi:hypothetical protein
MQLLKDVPAWTTGQVAMAALIAAVLGALIAAVGAAVTALINRKTARMVARETVRRDLRAKDLETYKNALNESIKAFQWIVASRPEILKKLEKTSETLKQAAGKPDLRPDWKERRRNWTTFRRYSLKQPPSCTCIWRVFMTPATWAN